MESNLERYFTVTDFQIVGAYVLKLTFDDGSSQRIDFEPLLYGPVFEPLRNIAIFNQVRLNIDTGTIEWPTGADFNPTILHDWPRYGDQIVHERRARYGVVAAKEVRRDH